MIAKYEIISWIINPIKIKNVIKDSIIYFLLILTILNPYILTRKRLEIIIEIRFLHVNISLS